MGKTKQKTTKSQTINNKTKTNKKIHKNKKISLQINHINKT